ncbi:hypothetical protein A3K82_00690 [Candidatus Pacearchaeota archaeon RBG_19FT_COMBO_34_9]|nr:MAG: hypothetical protein A3K82_00690 [Candidatus Pacearchaeota archaeon RBG_19FT_COMBO_34_9]
MGIENIIDEDKSRFLVTLYYLVMFIGSILIITYFYKVFSWWLTLIFFILGILHLYFLLQLLNQIKTKYQIKDNLLAQSRTNLELQNVKLIKELDYKINEQELTNSLRRLIGKKPIFPKEREEKLREEYKDFKNKRKEQKKKDKLEKSKEKKLLLEKEARK